MRVLFRGYALVLSVFFAVPTHAQETCTVSMNDIPRFHSLIDPARQPFGFRDLFYHRKHGRMYINLLGMANTNFVAHYDWNTNTISGLKMDAKDELMHLIGWGGR